MNWIECSWAVIPDQHGRAAAVVFRQDLRAAAASAIAIVSAYLLIAQVLDSLRLARFGGFQLLPLLLCLREDLQLLFIISAHFSMLLLGFLVILSGCVPSGTVVTQEWQAPVMGKRNESAAAPRLAFVIDIAKHTIASILVIPHFAI